MTNKEAIEELKKVDTLDMPARLCEAHYMAIKALEQEPCGDLINRQEVLDGIGELKRSPWATDKRGNGFEYLIAEALDVVADLCVKQASSVSPQEPKTGHWIDVFGGVECSECGGLEAGYSDFCPNCGCRMVEPQESEEI